MPGETKIRIFNGFAIIELSAGDAAEHEHDGSRGSETTTRPHGSGGIPLKIGVACTGFWNGCMSR